MLPDFLYIGPPKAGSSWLFEYFREHPEVYVPVAKDIYFFDRHFERGLDWYERFFAEAAGSGALRVGEICHDYLYSQDARSRIRDTLGYPLLLSILRDPCERAWSHYRYSLMHGNVQGDFFSAVEQNPAILELGLYGKYLVPWIESWGSEKVLLLHFEDLRNAPSLVDARLRDFLSLTQPSAFDLQSRVNVASRSRWPPLTWVAGKLAHGLRHAGFASLVGRLKRSVLRNVFFVEERGVSHRIPDDVKEFCRAYYTADAAVLASECGVRVQWA